MTAHVAALRGMRPRDLLQAHPPGWWAGQAILSAVAVWLLLRTVPPALAWLWSGADWRVVAANLRNFAFFRYPLGDAWRIGASLAVVSMALGVAAGAGSRLSRSIGTMLAGALAALAAVPLLAKPLLAAGSSLGELAAAFAPAQTWFAASAVALLAARAAAAAWIGARPSRRGPARALRSAWLVALPIVAALLFGASGGVGRWGGLLLTIVLATAAIGLSFPVGVLLALGRRSRLPLVRLSSVAFIELMRGMPLITVLFMAAILVPLLLPDAWRPEAMFRAIVGLTLFSAAYVAEDVRGGLNAVSAGQYDAARALGLGGAATYRLVVLPQALRIVIPAIVGQLIALLKDTSLVFVIGLIDVFEVARTVVSQAAFLGRFREALAFAALVYFLLCTGLARASRSLESPEGERP